MAAINPVLIIFFTVEVYRVSFFDNNTFSFLVTVPAEERRASHFYFSDNQESKESLIKVFLVSWKFCDCFIHKPAVKTTN